MKYLMLLPGILLLCFSFGLSAIAVMTLNYIRVILCTDPLLCFGMLMIFFLEISFIAIMGILGAGLIGLVWEGADL